MSSLQSNTNRVIYEIYPRSFSDSNGDGIGDLKGLSQRLDHIKGLGVDGAWLTPIFVSPQFDFGYDVQDYRNIHADFGTMQDFDQLLEGAHTRNIAVILDMVLAHTSIQHPWFRSHPEWYIWSDDVPNNWLSVFGGSAWQFDPDRGKYYYHRYYPEQPALNWHNPSVPSAMSDVLRFWVEKGVDGFRLDALDGLFVDQNLRDEPPSDSPGIPGRENDPWAAFWSLDHIYTTNLPQVIEQLRSLVESFPATAFVVEADLTSDELGPYATIADCAFSFEFFRAELDGNALARIIDGAGDQVTMAWALSNHDQPRMVSRWGRSKARVAAMLLLTLPGWAFIYQGDEIGMVDGKGGPVVYDRSGRDKVRHPMQWDRTGGFTSGEPWLPMVDPADCNVAEQDGRDGSMLELYRRLIGLREDLEGHVRVLDSSVDHLVFQRGQHLIVLNLRDEERRLEQDHGDLLFSTSPIVADGVLPRESGAIFRVEQPT